MTMDEQAATILEASGSLSPAERAVLVENTLRYPECQPTATDLQAMSDTMLRETAAQVMSAYRAAVQAEF